MAVEHQIEALVESAMGSLSPNLRGWLQSHLVQPRKVTLKTDFETQEEGQFWPVTDHASEDDSSCRIVFDEHAEMFGLEMTLKDGTQWMMGLYGGFAETVLGM